MKKGRKDIRFGSAKNIVFKLIFRQTKTILLTPLPPCLLMNAFIIDNDAIHIENNSLKHIGIVTFLPFSVYFYYFERETLLRYATDGQAGIAITYSGGTR